MANKPTPIVLFWQQGPITETPGLYLVAEKEDGSPTYNLLNYQLYENDDDILPEHQAAGTLWIRLDKIPTPDHPPQDLLEIMGAMMEWKSGPLPGPGKYWIRVIGQSAEEGTPFILEISNKNLRHWGDEDTQWIGPLPEPPE